jgi:hypothetical protein
MPSARITTSANTFSGSGSGEVSTGDESIVAVADLAQQLGRTLGRVVVIRQPGGRGVIEVQRAAGEALGRDARGEGRPALAVVLGRQLRGQLLLGAADEHGRLGRRRCDVTEELDELIPGDPFDEVKD